MVKPIEIILSAKRAAGSDIPQRILNSCRYLLPGAQQLLQQVDHGYVLEQWYDTPDAFFQLINVSTTQKWRVPFHTTRYDLYAFHSLAGSSFRIAPINGQPNGSDIRLDQGQYRLSYLPPASYYADFEAGDCLIFFFVIKPSLLFREHSPELYDPITPPVEALRQRLSTLQVSPARATSQTARQRIIHYLRNPGETYLQRLQTMQSTLIFLLRHYLSELQLLQLQDQSELQIIAQVKAHIRMQIADGAPLTLYELADQSGLSLSYLKTLFVKYEQISLSRYILEEKLDLSRQLLQRGMPVAQVAYFLCWNPSHFRRVFKLHHRISPKDFQQQSSDSDQK
ncbi:MAG: AraC family transcriptional regulator [Anaerolineaceae bacterium]